MTKELELGFFAPHVDSTFSIKEGETSVDLKLVEAKEIGSEASQREGERKPFSLIFRGPAGAALEQQIFKLEHDKAGTLEIFLVPVHPDEEGPCYEAVFN